MMKIELFLIILPYFGFIVVAQNGDIGTSTITDVAVVPNRKRSEKNMGISHPLYDQLAMATNYWSKPNRVISATYAGNPQTGHINHANLIVNVLPPQNGESSSRSPHPNHRPLLAAVESLSNSKTAAEYVSRAMLALRKNHNSRGGSRNGSSNKPTTTISTIPHSSYVKYDLYEKQTVRPITTTISVNNNKNNYGITTSTTLNHNNNNNHYVNNDANDKNYGDSHEKDTSATNNHHQEYYNQIELPIYVNNLTVTNRYRNHQYKTTDFITPRSMITSYEKYQPKNHTDFNYNFENEQEYLTTKKKFDEYSPKYESSYPTTTTTKIIQTTTPLYHNHHSQHRHRESHQHENQQHKNHQPENYQHKNHQPENHLHESHKPENHPHENHLHENHPHESHPHENHQPENQNINNNNQPKIEVPKDKLIQHIQDSIMKYMKELEAEVRFPIEPTIITPTPTITTPKIPKLSTEINTYYRYPKTTPSSIPAATIVPNYDNHHHHHEEYLSSFYSPSESHHPSESQAKEYFPNYDKIPSTPSTISEFYGRPQPSSKHYPTASPPLSPTKTTPSPKMNNHNHKHNNNYNYHQYSDEENITPHIDLTFNSKSRPKPIDLTALDVGQTWTHLETDYHQQQSHQHNPHPYQHYLKTTPKPKLQFNSQTYHDINAMTYSHNNGLIPDAYTEQINEVTSTTTSNPHEHYSYVKHKNIANLKQQQQQHHHQEYNPQYPTGSTISYDPTQATVPSIETVKELQDNYGSPIDIINGVPVSNPYKVDVETLKLMFGVGKIRPAQIPTKQSMNYFSLTNENENNNNDNIFQPSNSNWQPSNQVIAPPSSLSIDEAAKNHAISCGTYHHNLPHEEYNPHHHHQHHNHHQQSNKGHKKFKGIDIEGNGEWGGGGGGSSSSNDDNDDELYSPPRKSKKSKKNQRYNGGNGGGSSSSSSGGSSNGRKKNPKRQKSKTKLKIKRIKGNSNHRSLDTVLRPPPSPKYVK